MQYYSLDGTINEFFSRCTVTWDECDQKAVQLTGEAVRPVPIQGSFSYTVAGEKLLVQFRASHSPLDTERLALARTIHGDVVPACVAKETFGPSPALTVYVMEKVPGITYIEASLASLRCPAWQERTVADLARCVPRRRATRPQLTCQEILCQFVAIPARGGVLSRGV